MKNKILLAFAVGSAAGLVAGCQTYDFEPVEPLAVAQTTQSRTVVGQQPKPNLMFLIDKSGSMDFPADDKVAPCTPGCYPNCGTGCVTRLNAMKAAMKTFLAQNGTVAWTGMAVYPTAVDMGASCGPTSQADIKVQLDSKPTDLDADLRASAAAVSAEIDKVGFGGGTPTAASLAFLGNYDRLLDPDPKFKREDFILLLTDGLPNCNNDPVTQPNSCATPATCKCTLVPATNCSPTSYCREGCLDANNSADQITALRGKDIRTIVIGFGADTASGDGPDTLNAMAEQGGFARSCPLKTDAECGANNTCNVATGICSRKFYQATNADELGRVLAAISAQLDPAGICNYMLTEIPQDEKYLAVIIDGQNQPSGPTTWTYSAGKVTFNGALCDKVTAAKPSSPVQVEFRIVKTI